MWVEQLLSCLKAWSSKGIQRLPIHFKNAAAHVTTPGPTGYKQGFLFDVPSLEPLVDNAGMERVWNIWRVS